MNERLAKILIISGLFLILAGLGLIFRARLNFPVLGRLPGDFVFKKGDFTVYLPLATSFLISLIVSLVIYFISRR